MGATLEQATHDGHRLVPVLLALGLASGLVALVVGFIERRVRFPRSVRVAFAWCCSSAWPRVSRASGIPRVRPRRSQSVAGMPSRTPSKRSERQRRSAARLVIGRRADPALACLLARLRARSGPRSGSGTFWESWARYRTIPSDSTQAHSLYLGALGELGIVGLGCCSPCRGAVRGGCRRAGERSGASHVGRIRRLGCACGIDWDWALLGVTAPALLCGVALIKSNPRPPLPIPGAVRTAGVVAIGLLLAFAVPTLIADLRLRSATAEGGPNPGVALADAHQAARLEPWSSEPYVVMADAYRRSAIRKLLAEHATGGIEGLVELGHLGLARRREALDIDMPKPKQRSSTPGERSLKSELELRDVDSEKLVSGGPCKKTLRASSSRKGVLRGEHGELVQAGLGDRARVAGDASGSA